MDSLASLALATEPPTDALLDRPPVNRSQSLVTRQMWFNMVGHALYQLAVCFWILFEGPKTFVDSSGQPLVEGHQFERENHGAPSQHLTILFNAFDKSRDGAIDAREFLTTMAVMLHPSDVEAQAALAFEAYDLNGDGRLDRHELRQVLGSLHGALCLLYTSPSPRD